MAGKKPDNDDNRDVFEKALDVVFPATVGLTGGYVGARIGSRIGNRIAKNAVRKDRAMGGNVMSRKEAEEFAATARRSMGAMGAMTLGPIAGVTADNYRKQKRRK